MMMATRKKIVNCFSLVPLISLNLMGSCSEILEGKQTHSWFDIIFSLMLSLSRFRVYSPMDDFLHGYYWSLVPFSIRRWIWCMCNLSWRIWSWWQTKSFTLQSWFVFVAAIISFFQTIISSIDFDQNGCLQLQPSVNCRCHIWCTSAKFLRSYYLKRRIFVWDYHMQSLGNDDLIGAIIAASQTTSG